MTDEQDEVQETQVERPSLFGMIMNPGVQLERIKQNPKIWISFIVVTVFTTLGMYMMSRGIDLSIHPDFIGMGEDSLQLMEFFTKVTVVLTGVFMPALSILINSAIYIAVAKVAKYTVSFKQLFSMNTYIFVISMLSALVNGLVTMFVNGGDGETLFTSVNSMIGATGPIGVLLNSFEVFTVWNIIISALGLQIVARFSKKLSWAVILIIYILSTGFSMMSAAITSLVGI